MTTRELRRKYIQFFESKGHLAYPSGSLIPYDVTGRLDESLLFNGAGMIQFKPYFRGVAEPPKSRLTTAQKCVRTGDIEEVGDSSHLTFFEMLGNFSFGDYFKADAIAYSWEFLTSKKWLGLDPNRLAFTVYSEDDEAFGMWSEHLKKAGINPDERIFRLGEDTNYWPAGAFSKGPPGPCGPNSEMFYWTSNTEPVPSGPYTVEDYTRDDKAGKWLEIWNDVFIQYEWQGQLKDAERPNLGYEKTGMPELPFRSIDTGMGLERTSAVLSGLSSVYDTDAFQTIIRTIEEVAGTEIKYGEDSDKDRAIRIISDHIRTACFCIADGILPGNSGRGYVLRRLIRRAVLQGVRALDFTDPFFHLVYEGVASTMGDAYPELNERREVIIRTLENEEALFRRTIAAGSDLLNNWIENLKAKNENTLDGEAAFKLYDTFGFPLEVTQELCDEAEITVDSEGYEVAMKRAQELSRGASAMDSVYGGVEGGFLMLLTQDGPTPTEFVGYEQFKCEARITAALAEADENGAATGRIAIALDRTPFYAESGGQVSDTGLIEGPGFTLRVDEMIKQEGVYVHACEILKTAHPEPIEGMPSSLANEVVYQQLFDKDVTCTIDLERRKAIMRHHTVTHLLHAALREVLGKHVTQAGSLVEPGHLRFDFTHGKAMTPDEIKQVEEIVNRNTLAGHGVNILIDVPIDVAKARGAMALFGEKYGNSVRVVEIRDFNEAPVSIELCGGCHVPNTGQIGLFKIKHEASAASGIRRIEAVSGEAAIAYVNDQIATLRQASTLLKSNPHDLVAAVERTLDHLKEEKKKREKLAQSTGGSGDVQSQMFGEIELVIQQVTDLDPKEAQMVADRLTENHLKRISLVVAKGEGKVTFICKIGRDAVSAGAHAGNIVKHLASQTGGGGGGRPDFATAGGRQLDQVPAAIAGLTEVVGAMIKN